jgi:hypothetical protein
MGIFVEYAVFNITYNTTSTAFADQNLYIIQLAKLRKLPSNQVLTVFGLNGNVVQIVDRDMFDWTRFIPKGADVPPAYANPGDEFLIRFYNQKQVFYVANGTRHGLNSMNFFSYKPNLDLEKQIVLTDYDDITIFKLGSEIA